MTAVVLNAVRRSFYLDSVALMRLSREVAALPDVVEAALMMGTPANKQILSEAGLLEPEGRNAAVSDLILAVSATHADAAQAAMARAISQLDRPRTSVSNAMLVQPRTLRAALRNMPDANLALISVPGDFAMAEAGKAIRNGLDVMIFSDNVALDAEAALKREAKKLGRLVMGADCGTAIINAVPLAFANRVPSGDVGIIGASGTGIQEISCLLAHSGRGISQAVGVGSRDLSFEVGALTTLAAIDLLDSDAATHRIVLVSKPPHPEVAQKVLARVAASRKPFTICFLGATGMQMPANAHAATTLRAAAEHVLGSPLFGNPTKGAGPQARRGAIVGLYSGGTLAGEAQIILLDAGRSVESNAPVPGARPLKATGSTADRILDLGADEFTRGRPHPMIDPKVRTDLLRATLADTNIGVVLLDLVIGFGAHPDPATEIAAVLRGRTEERPHVVASVTGTEDDPQVRSRQVTILEAAGVLVAPSNAHAAELALAL
ncbi:MAG TPA: acyl-CoA synthetase FdrA [Xanthobacteraceae bacterium]|nr:acyl-CoA synthetase FdrA [Xanthobacteraceae bacterium]